MPLTLSLGLRLLASFENELSFSFEDFNLAHLGVLALRSKIISSRLSMSRKARSNSVGVRFSTRCPSPAPLLRLMEEALENSDCSCCVLETSMMSLLV